MQYGRIMKIQCPKVWWYSITIGAIFHGAAFPCMIIFYGQMTENFVQWSICDEMTALVNCRNYYSNHLGIKPDQFEENTYCDDSQFTFDLQFMDEEDCPDGSVIEADSEGMFQTIQCT